MLSTRQEVLYGMVLVHRILVAYTVCLVSVCDLRICRLVNRLQPSPSESAVGGRKIPTTGSVPSTRPALITQQRDSPASVQLTGAFVIKKPAHQSMAHRHHTGHLFCVFTTNKQMTRPTSETGPSSILSPM